MSDHSTNLFTKVRNYNWEGNPEFQGGLQTILSNAPTDQHDILTNRAKCFYFQKKTRLQVDEKAFQAWLAGEDTTAGENVTAGAGVSRGAESAVPGPAEEEPPYPKSFAEVVELITTGKPVPGIREIPDVVLEAPAEPPTVPARKKPWEKE